MVLSLIFFKTVWFAAFYVLFVSAQLFSEICVFCMLAELVFSALYCCILFLIESFQRSQKARCFINQLQKFLDIIEIIFRH